MPLYDKSRIKPEILESLERYATQGIPTGGFLQAVLENDLKESFAMADEGNIASMFHIVAYCYNDLPSTCWGSPQKVQDWLDVHRLERQRLAAEAER